jgi:hypothetical protein
MPGEVKSLPVSLRDFAEKSIAEFLGSEGFIKNEILTHGLLEITNLISDYHEEGAPLFPEIIITESLKIFETIPKQILQIKESELSSVEFRNAIKLCAPLALESWVIFIEISESKLKYGLVTAEMSETSLSIYDQIFGQLKIEYEEIAAVYVRNIGEKVVELIGLKNSMVVSLTLAEPKETNRTEINQISAAISNKCGEEYKVQIISFIEKTINAALRTGHGNLIAIVEDEEKSINDLKTKETNCIYLKKEIDFEKLIFVAETDKTIESSAILKAFTSIAKSMLNHDGITVFTNRGKILGYHLLIENYEGEGGKILGGSRLRAFHSICNCNFFCGGFYKSQDGNMKIWLKK